MDHHLVINYSFTCKSLVFEKNLEAVGSSALFGLELSRSTTSCVTSTGCLKNRILCIPESLVADALLL